MKKINKYHFGKSSTRRKEGVSIYLQRAADLMISCSPVDVGVPWMGGKRTAEDQHGIFKDGNTRCDGYEKLSYHQETDDDGKGLAIDLVPYINGFGFHYSAYGRFGIIGTLMLEAWEELQEAGEIPKDLYLHWGGFWSSKDQVKLGWDLAHYEIRDYPQKLQI